MGRGRTQQLEEALTIAESRIAALEADLRAAVALLCASERHGQCPHWRRERDDVLARPTVAALREDSHDD